jgi:perosamine synthetase
VSLPVAERLSQEVISLPVHPLLSEAELATIADEVNKL